MKTMNVRMLLGVLLAANASTASSADETLYSADFKWVGSNGTHRIVLAKVKKPGFKESKIVAKIFNGKRCEAICSAQKLEMSSAAPAAPGLLEMSCKSASFGALAAPATLFFRDQGTGRKISVLRFGTWLQGYEQAVLTTEVDRSTRLVEEMARPASEPVKLARTR